MPDKTDEKQGKFIKGKSGNPFGRPRGVRNRATVLAEKLFEDDIEEICKQAIDQAKKGNIHAIKLILDRIFPIKKEASFFIDLPCVNNAQDILKAVNRVAEAICEGKISPSEGELLTRIIDRQAKAIELNDFELRLRSLEDKNQ